MIKFSRVSLDEYTKGLYSLANTYTSYDDDCSDYCDIKLPKRATKGSAGYDFFSTISVTLKPGESVKIPTGIKAIMDDDFFLAIVPRSGLGFKYRIQLDNTIGIIDSDYTDADNEGHIWLKITNDSKIGRSVSIKKGQAIAQGIFLSYNLTDDDVADDCRIGGFGSTDKN